MSEQAYTYCDECGAMQVGLGNSCHACGEKWVSWSVAYNGERVGHGGPRVGKFTFAIIVGLVMWGIAAVIWRIFV